MPTDPAVCPNCGATFASAYCGACGQRRIRGRITIPGLVAAGMRTVLDLENGLVRTARDLTMRPGRTVQEYLAGRRASYMNPIGYLFFCVGATTVLYILIGFGDHRFTVFAIPDIPGLDAISPNLILMVNVPIMAVWSWAGFRKSGRTFAENLVLNVYIYGHLNAFLLLMSPFYLLLPTNAVDVAVAIVNLGYTIWIYRTFFEKRGFGGMTRVVLIAMFATSGAAVFSGFLDGAQGGR